ncbi:calcium/sodium antiporter [Bowmanella dokdonensis]|uniref:Calcium/sodium antiporter n=1 Tax=Bowmanella dokdonensis TaxID=751969 RepID=A0A939DJW2_9ALTE|nr:calcium/sodium antiporter [Bowmanella dokdonensis]MBN7824058.1 calcium/sodium antiporter [Bowmanella dokdonensis]
MLTEIFIFIAGLAILSWSADRFILGASALARNLGIAPLVIGMTIVAMGSSAPEIMVAFNASLAGSADTAIGNAIGSNIANIGLVLGLTALLRPLVVSSVTLKREMPVVMLVSLLAAWLLADLSLSRYEGGALLVLFFFSIGALVWLSLRMDAKDPLVREMTGEIPQGLPTPSAVFWLLLGLVLLPLSAHFMVESATSLARYFGVSDLVIGLTIIAVGTSLPELAACIAGVMKGEDDLALGNILGSNIFNILAVLSMPGLLAPGAIDPQATYRDMPVMLAMTLLLILFSFAIRGRQRLERWQGGLLLTSFIAYQTTLFQHQV